MTYHNPRWITVRFAGRCAKCNAPIARGAEAFYFPEGRRLLCNGEECGKAGARTAEAASESAAVAAYVAAGLGEW